jgi:hypothetical protein
MPEKRSKKAGADIREKVMDTSRKRTRNENGAGGAAPFPLIAGYANRQIASGLVATNANRLRREIAKLVKT